MRRMQHTILASMITLALAALSGCGGSAQAPHASPSSLPKSNSAQATTGIANGAPNQPPPAGYRWVGGAAQGISFAVPNSWATVNLAKISINQALSRFAVGGLNTPYMRMALSQLSQRHAIIAADPASAVRSPHHFATNANGFCIPTAMEPSANSASVLRSLTRAEYAKINAHVLAIKSIRIDGDPGVKTKVTLTTTTGITLYETQYAVLTKNSRFCYMTLGTDMPAAFGHIFTTIGRTMHVR